MPKKVPWRNWGTLTIPEKWDPSLNPNWRPKSSIRKVNDALIEAWEEPATRADIEKTYVLLTW